MNTRKLVPVPFENRPLWEGTPPLATPEDAERKEHFCEDADAILRLTDVTVPTITFYPATASGSRPRPAVVVAPGGGYGILAWNHEGIDICAWLNSIGVSAFLLKYRCPNRRDAALADIARAVRVVRAEAESLNVLPDKIGVIGFSAGAHLCARLSSLPAGKAPYPAADAIDATSCRPDFQMLIYPAYIDRDGLGTDPDFDINADTPPAFLIQSEDDFVYPSSVAYFVALQKAGVKAELHVFSHGGHGYGMLRTGNPTSAWPRLAATWIETDVMGGTVW